MNDILNIKGVRAYLDKEGAAQLNLEDVARGLGFVTVATSGNECVRWNTVFNYLEEFGVATSCNGRAYQEMCPDFIPENIFYKLCFKAKSQAAIQFQDRVTDEILPTIRKHGVYMTPKAIEEAILTPDFIIQIAGKLKEEQEQRAKAEAQIEANAPLVLFAESVQASGDSILIGELSKILKQNGIDIGQKRLFAWLREHGYLMKAGEERNLPTQYSMNLGLFEIKKGLYADSSGNSHVTNTTKVTAKGQTYFVNVFLKKKAKDAEGHETLEGDVAIDNAKEAKER